MSTLWQASLLARFFFLQHFDFEQTKVDKRELLACCHPISFSDEKLQGRRGGGPLKLQGTFLKAGKVLLDERQENQERGEGDEDPKTGLFRG